MSGRSPLRLLDDNHPDTWSPLDLDILAKWKHIKEDKCQGCGRPLAQHLYNSTLGRAEEPEDYIPYTIDCPAVQAIADGQEMWKRENKYHIDRYHKDQGADPGMGIYWIAKGHNEALPHQDLIPQPE